jgi:ATP-dependent DNA helicase
MCDSETLRFTKLIPKIYLGSKEERERIRSELIDVSEGGKLTLSQCNILITHYDLFRKDMEFFSKFHWAYLVIDEGHYFKNHQSKIYQETMMNIPFGPRLLLTGTPAQNNIVELWALLNFLNPDIFQNRAPLNLWETWFVNLDNEGLFKIILKLQFTSQNIHLHISSSSSSDRVNNLLTILKPFMLRRVKEEVLTTLPPKKEIMMEVPLSKMQKKYYKWILTKNFDAIQYAFFPPK